MWNAEEGYNLTMFRSGRFQVKIGNIGLGCGASKSDAVGELYRENHETIRGKYK
jgi:hypothetical protein